MGTLCHFVLSEPLPAFPSWFAIVSMSHIVGNILPLEEAPRYVLQVVYSFVEFAFRHVSCTNEVEVVVVLHSHSLLSPRLQLSLALRLKPLVVVYKLVGTQFA